jgi:hypothetical protein
MGEMFSKSIFIIIIIFFTPFTYSQNISESISFEEKRIENKEITIEVEIEGVTQAYDEYDIKSPIDGEIISISCDLFDHIKKTQNIIKMATGEVGALLKTAKTENEKKEILKRWDGMFNYTYIQPTYDGIVTSIKHKSGEFVNKNDTIMTVSRKIRLIARNKEKLYMEPQPGINAIVKGIVGVYKLTLTNFLKENTEGYYKMFLDFDEIPNIKVGEKLSGKILFVKKTSTRVVPNDDLIEYKGKKYLIIEIQPGVISEKETEIESFGFNYLKIKKKEKN